MTATTETATARTTEDEFPDVEIAVTPVTDRARATFAKTHNRPMMASFVETFGSSK